MSDKPILIPRDDGLWELAENYGEVPKGFVTDGASIPRFLWRVLGTPIEADTIGAVIKHDWRYETMCIDRKRADDELYNDLRAAGVGYIRAKLYYYGVRIFGAKHYGK